MSPPWDAVAVVLPVAWTVLVAAGCHRRRPPARLSRLLTPVRPAVAGTEPVPPRLGAGVGVVEAVGRAARRVAGRRGGDAVEDRARDRRLGRAVLVAFLLLVVAPLAAVPAGALVWAWPAMRQRAARRRAEEAVLRQLPEVVDLLVLAVGSGLSVSLAVAAVGRRGDGPLADALAAAVEDASLGRRLADALDEVPELVGEGVRPLTAALVASERYGAPLLDRLERLSGDVRADQRRRAEEAARRVPVKMLFPLVLCTLPAFGLLTLAPLLAGAVRSLRP